MVATLSTTSSIGTLFPPELVELEPPPVGVGSAWGNTWAVGRRGMEEEEKGDDLIPEL